MHFDWTISLGTIISLAAGVLTVIAAFNAVSARIAVFEQSTRQLADSLKAYAIRQDRYEERTIELISHVQRLIGRSEPRHPR